MKKIFLICFAILGALFLIACDNHECSSETWVLDAEGKCSEEWTYTKYCDVCGKIIDTKSEYIDHDYYEETVDASCLVSGAVYKKCHRCNYSSKIQTIKATGHEMGEFIVTTEALQSKNGVKTSKCNNCEYTETKSYCYQYIDKIGYKAHGKLYVDGQHLKDKDGNKFQLRGISTHGLQWYPQFVTDEGVKAVIEEFNINVLRLSLYTAEDGYCECSEKKKEELYQLVCKGINIATQNDLYCIVDWHMLGEEDENDRNPQYYQEEAIEFFDRITTEFKDYDNILFEICNEPCGKTTWAQVKSYANAVIPVIRENMPDAIILVGCPKWSSDLNSVKSSPLTGYTNIMYTYHFYAADIISTSTAKSFIQAGYPLFVTEHGGMDADGDGAIDKESCSEWYKLLNANNISYVAWNMSNSGGSSAIMKARSSNITDFSNTNLKEWGVYYKSVIKARLLELYNK